MNLERKSCEAPEFKMSEGENGGFSGYGSTFNNLDRQGEIVAPGAFAKSLEQFEKEGFITIGHDWDCLPVASIKSAREDQKGLWIDAEFHSTPQAQACRTYMRERIARRKSVGLSIGYWVKDDERTREGRLLKEIALAECSVVTVPANPAAGASSAKSETATVTINTNGTSDLVKLIPASGSGNVMISTNGQVISPPQAKAEYLGAYAEQEATWGMLDSLQYSLQSALFNCLFMGDGSREECLAAADACLAEYHSLVMKAITALYPTDLAAVKVQAEDVKAAWNLTDPSDPPAGKEFDREIERTLAALSDLIPRSREIAKLRAKSGRTLSAARRADLAQLHADLGTLLEETQPRATDAERLAAELSFLRHKAQVRAYG